VSARRDPTSLFDDQNLFNGARIVDLRGRGWYAHEDIRAFSVAAAPRSTPSGLSRADCHFACGAATRKTKNRRHCLSIGGDSALEHLRFQLPRYPEIIRAVVAAPWLLPTAVLAIT
jgi:hypothetical protein